MGFPPSPALSQEALLQRYGQDPLGLLLECQAELGDLFTLELGLLNGENSSCNGKWVFLTRPEQMRLMFRAPISQLHAGEANAIFFGIKTASTGSIRMDGEAHMQRRKLFQPFFNGPNIVQYIGEMQRVTLDLIEQWPRSEPFPLLCELQRMTINIIIHTLFGIKAHGMREPLCERLLVIENARYSHAEVLAVEKDLSRLLYSMIREYEPDVSRSDIFSLMMNTRDESGSMFDDKEIHDELISLLKAGFGTTANTLCWIFECLLNHPEALQKAKAEAHANLRPNRIATNDNLNKMKYMENVIRETLRLRPLSAINGCRLCKTPFEIDGYLLPAGTILVNCAFLLHRRPELYPEPERFLPERFDKIKPSPYEWTPFGGGTRMCIGRSFATMEMKLIVASILQCLELELVDPEPGAQRQGFFLAPKRGLMVQLR